MAGILYLYRLLIYQVERGQNREVQSLLALMAMRLYRYITIPAMVAATAAGGAMIWLMPEIMQQGWMHIKITLVLLLMWSTIYAGGLVKKVQNGHVSSPSSGRLRLYNEIPTILMLIVVGMVVFKPFT